MKQMFLPSNHLITTLHWKGWAFGRIENFFLLYHLLLEGLHHSEEFPY